jgi:uncharacterized protein with PQ loop repeat
MNIFDIVFWIPHTLYATAILPQIYKNYHLRSTAGLSIPMVFSRFSGELSYIIYIYSLGLPMVYKVMIPIYTFNIGMVLVQAMYYAPNKVYRGKVIMYMAIALSLFASGWTLAQAWPVFVGRYAGWLAVSTLAFAQIPQAYKNYTRKSVHGFSLGYTLLMGLGSFIELCYVIALQLPVQTLASCTRSLFFYTIYWYQFIKYTHDHVDEQELV